MFNLNAKSLSLFRIGISSIVFLESYKALTNYLFLYSSTGAVPLALLEYFPGKWSLFFICEHGWFGIFLISLLAFTSFLLGVGFKTKFSSIVCWVLLVSLQVRSPYSDFGGDGFQRVTLFWAMFLPLGEYWSIDSWRQKEKREPIAGASNVWSMGFIFQLIILYIMTTLLKHGPAWRSDFNAVELSLAKDTFSTELGEWLLNFPNLLTAATHATIWLEGVGPLLLLVPFARPQIRLIVSLSFIIFHAVLLGLTMHLWTFPWIGAVAWIALLPSIFWNRGKEQDGKYKVSSWRETPVQAFFAFTFIALILLWNSRMLVPESKRSEWPPEPIAAVTRALHLHQSWRMFAPEPGPHDFWFVCAVELESGETIDFFNKGQHLDFSIPEEKYERLRNFRYRKFLLSLARTDSKELVESYIRFTKREWEEQSGQRIKQIKLFRCLSEYHGRGKPETVQCFSIYPYEINEEQELVFPEIDYPPLVEEVFASEN